MTTINIEDWALNEIRNLFPLDDDSLRQLVQYVLSLSSTEEISSYLVDLLGDSPDLRTFVQELGRKLLFKGQRTTTETKTSNSTARLGTDAESKVCKNGIILENPETVITKLNPGVYAKQGNLSFSPALSSSAKYRPEKTTFTTRKSPSVMREPKLPHPKHSTSGSMGKLTSDLGVNRPVPKSAKGPTKLNALSEIDAALREMELEEGLSPSKINRKCSCQAQRHPLNPLTPNCLHCGKISCLAEGSGPCTFCGRPMLSKQERQEIIMELKQERSRLKTQQSNKKKASSSSVTSSWARTAGNVNSPLPVYQDEKRLSEMEEHKNRLLEYDRTSAAQSRIIDEASDYNDIPSVDKWASPAERALQLKRQQRALRALEKKKQKVMNLNLTTQEVTYLDQTDESETEDFVIDSEPITKESSQTSIQRPTAILKFIPSSKNSLCFEPKELNQRLRESKWQRVLYEDD